MLLGGKKKSANVEIYTARERTKKTNHMAPKAKSLLDIELSSSLTIISGIYKLDVNTAKVNPTVYLSVILYFILLLIKFLLLLVYDFKCFYFLPNYTAS